MIVIVIAVVLIFSNKSVKQIQIIKQNTPTTVKQNTATTTLEQNVATTTPANGKISIDDNTCELIIKNRKSFLPNDAEQYLCDQEYYDKSNPQKLGIYNFNLYIYPTGGTYQRQIPNGELFSRKIEPFYSVFENFVDQRQYNIDDKESLKSIDWVDIGCYFLDDNNIKFCNVGVKTYLNGTTTKDYYPTESY